MKKFNKISTIALSALVCSGLAIGCTEEMPEVIETLNLSRVLTPASTSALVSTSDGHTVNFTWANSNTATQYEIEVYQWPTASAPADITDDVLSTASPYDVYTVEQSSTGSQTTAAIDLPADYTYFARVKGQAPDQASLDDSNWAVFPYPIETYYVMSSIENYTVTERTSNTITLSWVIPAGDAEGVNQIRVSPNPNGNAASAYAAYDVADGATSVTIDGLQPSVRYTFAAHYGSANRGSIAAWTRPDMTGTTLVADTAAFHQAVADGATSIRLAYADTVYNMGQMSITAPNFSLYGEETVSGSKPTIIGSFSLADGVTDFRVEGISFDGNAYGQTHLITFASAITTPINSINVTNCDITAFRRGLLYVSTGTPISSVNAITFNSIYLSDVNGEGGEAFGFRGTTDVKYGSIGTITVTNSTFTDGMREFFRIDDSYDLNSFVFTNNTLNNLTTQANSYGVFYIRSPYQSITVSKNLFLNFAESSVHDVNGRYVIGASAFVPTTCSGNYWYNMGSGANIFCDAGFSSAMAVSGSGAILGSDPCYNSERGIFNVTNAAVLAAGAGDPRWLTDYVPQPDPDLEVVEYGHVWDLTDTDTYYDVIDESCVRGNTKFIVSSNPINVGESGFTFTAEASTEYGGTPSDCAMAFLVDGPGSVVISTVSAGASNNHITVAYGDPEGANATVAGSAAVDNIRERVAFPDFVPGEQHLIYIYACGPITLSELSWIESTSTGGTTPLETPVVSISAEEASEGSVTLSWDAVSSAASYMVKWTGPTSAQEDSVSVTSTNYDLNIGRLATGIYNFSVRADIAETDAAHENSELSEPVKFIRREVLSPVTSTGPTTWGLEDFTFMQALIGSAENTNPESIWGNSFVYNNLEYYAGNTIRFANSYDQVVFQYPGSSNNPPNRRYLRFLASGNGTLEVRLDATSAGRSLYVQVDGVSGEGHEAALNGSGGSLEGVGSFTETVTASEGSEIILWADASLRIYEITWTPLGYDPDAELPAVAGLTPVKETTTWGSEEYLLFYDQRTDQSIGYGADFTVPEPYYVFNNLMIYASGTMRVAAEGQYIQLSGASYDSNAGEDISSYSRRYLRFRVAGNGTLTLYARATNGSGHPGRKVYVAVGGSADQNGVGTIQDDAWDAGSLTSLDTPHNWEITANNGDSVTIVVDNALRIGQITWTPAN